MLPTGPRHCAEGVRAAHRVGEGVSRSTTRRRERSSSRATWSKARERRVPWKASLMSCSWQRWTSRPSPNPRTAAPSQNKPERPPRVESGASWPRTSLPLKSLQKSGLVSARRRGEAPPRLSSHAQRPTDTVVAIITPYDEQKRRARRPHSPGHPRRQSCVSSRQSVAATKEASRPDGLVRPRSVGMDCRRSCCCCCQKRWRA
jgi:hypothetical protein